jgi:type VI secretion system protein ImpC
VERALGAQIGAILQHPEVRRLEQAWRGVSFLVERAKAHSGIRFEVVSAPPADAAVAMARAIKANPAEPPVSCAIVDVTIDGTPASWNRLQAIAEVAEAHTVPTVINGSPRLLGVDDLSAVERLDNKAGLFDAPQQAPWRSASSKPETRWVTIAMNGVLARTGYDKATSRIREAVVKELPDDAGAAVWLSPAFVVGTLIMGSFRDTGWPHRILGLRSGGLVENLPVREVKGGYEGEDGMAIPTEAFVTTDTQRELSRSGVLLLAAAANSDAVYVLSAPTAYVTPAKRTYDSATTEPEQRLDRVTLVDQLFVARLAQFLRALCSKIPADSDPAEVAPVVEAAVWALFEDAPPGGPEIRVQAADRAVQVSVRPRRFHGASMEECSLEVPLG